MPRYDYECDSCHHRFELKQSFHSEPVATCPICQGASHRKFHSVPIVFKGAGWYVNDHRKSGKGGNNGRSASESKDTSDSGTETKPKSESASKPKATADSKAASKADSPAAKAKGE